MKNPDLPRVIWLHEPWATFVAIGVKRFETRSWSTRYTGRLLVGATKAWQPRYGTRFGPWMLTTRVNILHTTRLIDDVERDCTCDPSAGVYAGTCVVSPSYPAIVRFAEDGTTIVEEHRLTFGAIVADVQLGPVLPVVSSIDDDATGNTWPPDRPCVVNGGALHYPNATLLHCQPDVYPSADISEQGPFGDYTPGRYAWPLTESVQLELPVPAVGHQGLRIAPPELLDLVNRQRPTL